MDIAIENKNTECVKVIREFVHVKKLTPPGEDRLLSGAHRGSNLIDTDQSTIIEPRTHLDPDETINKMSTFDEYNIEITAARRLQPASSTHESRRRAHNPTPKIDELENMISNLIDIKLSERAIGSKTGLFNLLIFGLMMG